MNVEEVRGRLEDIEQIRNDPEVSHGYEDDLYEDIVEWIAKEAPSPFRDVAAEALKVRKMDLTRWYA